MYYITGRFFVVTLLVNFYYITACFLYYITGKSYYITGRYYIIGRFLLHYWSILRYRSIITLLVVTGWLKVLQCKSFALDLVYGYM